MQLPKLRFDASKIHFLLLFISKDVYFFPIHSDAFILTYAKPLGDIQFFVFKCRPGQFTS